MSPFDRYVSSPIYRVAPEHRLALLLAVAVVGWAAWRRIRAGRPVVPAEGLAVLDRVAVGAMAVAAVANLGMAVGRGGGVGVWLTAVAVVELWLVRRASRAGRWRGWAVVVLVTVLAVNLGLAVAGVTVDQVGFATALVQALALAALMRPGEGTGLRRVAASVLVVGAVGLSTLAVWAGAVVAGEGGERLGDTPLPGVLLPRGVDRSATDAELAAADELWRATAAAIARFEDVEVAAAAGYQVQGIVGSQFHAENPLFKSDGVILDPDRPETLVYEATPDGPVLLGALFEMEEIGVPGPAFGGPLTVWHAHDHLCLSLLPPALAGFESPLGGCGLGLVSLPITNEMIHVWTLPGVPERFGEIDEAWLQSYLAGESTAG